MGKEARVGRGIAVLTIAVAAAVLAPASASAIIFSGPTNFAAGDGPVGIAVENFDGNSDPDLAVANLGGDTVSILLGTGPGGGFAAPVPYAAGDGPRDVTAGLFDNDGDVDLAVANENSDNVSILLGNGDGTFGAATPFGAGDSPTAVEVGDFDENGAADLAVANLDSDDVSVLLGNGDGSFQPAVNIGASAVGHDVAIGDLNGDGHQDLVVAGSIAPAFNTLSILLGAGDGTFSAPTQVVAGDAVAVSVADLNDDGVPDLAVALPATLSVATLFGTGDGTFGGPTAYSVATGPFDIVARDLNGDAIPDIAAPNSTGVANSVSVLEGLGSGAFAPQDPFPVGAVPFALAIADYDEDGRMDLAATNQNDDNVSILLGAVTTPSLTTNATADATVGQAVGDQATLAGDDPTGTITFDLYGPGDDVCGGPPVYTEVVDVTSGNGVYGTTPFQPAQVGGYRWVATYSGDPDNDPVTEPCNSPNELTTVGQATPTLTTEATPEVELGGTIRDEATLSGGFNATGSISFSAYGPDDATCSGPPAFVSGPVAVNGDGTYSTAGFAPAAPGTYRWIASYSGDANHNSADGACNDPGESSLVRPIPKKATCDGRPATIVGTEGRDKLAGTDGPDVIAGLGGRDTIRGLGDDDVICGGRGRDRLFGGSGDDLLRGGKGRDRLRGGPGKDQLNKAGKGRKDRKGRPKDDCRGGPGADRGRCG